VWKDLQGVDECALILMGHLRTVTFIKQDDQGTLSGLIHYAIERVPVPMNGEFSLEKVTVSKTTIDSLSAENRTDERRVYYQLQAPEGDSSQEENAAGACILLPVPGAGQGIDYHHKLYMYYPIEKEPTGLPFIIHGYFTVSSDRTMLWEDDIENNQKVISKSLDLLGKSLPVLAGLEDLRDWLPWILMPVDLGDNEDKNRKIPSSWIHDEVRRRLRESACVPAQDSTSVFHLGEVHFLPSYPNAFRDFYSETGPGLRPENLRLPRKEIFVNYGRIRNGKVQQIDAAACQIGLGEFDIEDLVARLVAYGKLLQDSSNGMKTLPAIYAVEFFDGICSLLAAEKVREKAKTFASNLGEARVPILPVQCPDGSVGLVSAWKSELQDSEGWKRVVFRPPYPESGQDLAKQGIPVRDITVYFMPDNLEPSSRDVVKLYSIEWGLENFNGRADLFRSISERMDELSEVEDEPSIIAAFGYLAGLLSQITGELADDLRPRPYAFINIDFLKKALAGNKNNEREKLHRAQGWRRVKVPTQGQGLQEIKDVYFGLEWIKVLESAAEDDEQAHAWKAAIQTLDSLQKYLPNEIELLVPDDARWQSALHQMDRLSTGSKNEDPKLSLFKLLLLLGVRIGPRLEWRWLDKNGPDERDNCLGFNDYEKESRLPKLIEPSISDDQLANYSRFITIKEYSPAFTVEFGHYFSPHKWAKQGIVNKLETSDFLASLTWFPDLKKIGENRNNINFCDVFCDSIKTILHANLIDKDIKGNSFLWTGWFSNYENNSLIWQTPIPSFANFQLSHLPLWKSQNLGKEERFPACAMLAVPMDASLDSKNTDQLLPVFETGSDLETAQAVAAQLEIPMFEKLTPRAAAERFTWLLNRYRDPIETVGPVSWQINIGDNDSGNWEKLLNRLLKKIAAESAPDEWHKYLLASLGFVVRVVKHDSSNEWAVSYTYEKQKGCFNPEICYYDHAPRPWEKEPNRDKYFLMTDRTLDEELRPWAKALGANPLSPKDPNLNLADPLNTPEADAYRQQLITEVVKNRLDLILGMLISSGPGVKDLEDQARSIIGWVNKLQIIDSSPGSSPLGQDKVQDKVLLAQLKEKADPADLAFGLALKLDRVPILDGLYLALSAPREVVKGLLMQKGVDVKDLVKEVEELRQYNEKYLASVLAERLTILLKNLGMIGDDLTGETTDNVKEHARTLLIGKNIAWQIDAIQTCLEGEAVDAIPRACHLLKILREAGISSDDLKKIEFKSLFTGLDAAVEDKAYELITALVILQLAKQTQDLTDLPVIIDEAARKEKILRTQIGENSEVFITELKGLLGEGSLIPNGFIFEWLDDNWLGITNKVYEIAGLELVNELDLYSHVRVILNECINNRSLDRLPEAENQHIQDEVDHLSQKNDLKQKFINGDLFANLDFAPQPVGLPAVSFEAPKESMNSANSSQSEHDHKAEQVSLTQELRGMYAEFYVMECIWRQYLKAQGDVRRRILAVIQKSRTDGQIRGGKESGEKVARQLLENNEALLRVKEHNPDPRLKDLFREAIYLGDIGLAGFDVLDPFSPDPSANDGDLQPDWVEVKGVLQENNGLIYMTTHEFHTACGNSGHYKLRPVVIPSGKELDPLAYQLLQDLKPGSDEQVKSALVNNVFGGKFQLFIKSDISEQN
jgi:hypothetical protein